MSSIAFNTLVSLLAATRTTEYAARWTGVRTFLPRLSSKRFSAVGGIDEAVIIAQMDNCTSFQDEYWTKYWTAFAKEQLQRLDKELEKANLGSSQTLLDDGEMTSTSRPAILAFLARGAALITQTLPGTTINADQLPWDVSQEEKGSFVAVDALLKAVAYYFVAAWPGLTLERKKAHHTCQRLFDVLIDAVAPTLDLTVERHLVQANGEQVKVYAVLPNTSSMPAGAAMPAVLITNGLEGTNVETMASAVRTQTIVSTAWFFMEMPGTYAYKQPMSKASSEKVYRDVLDFMASHEFVDASRLGMVGISFGANCATRMAVADNRLKAVIVNGAPLGRSLKPTGSFGMPELLVQALFGVVGAKSLLELKTSLHELVPSRADIEQIQCPVLAINGENDTLISTQDTIDLAAWAPKSELYLYPNDDHCAMGHMREWLKLNSEWLMKNL